MSDLINREEQIPQKKKSFFKSRKFVIILAVLVIISSVVVIKGIAVARHFKSFADGPHDFLIGHLIDKLNLTDQQKTQVENLKAQIKDKRESSKPNRESMMEEFANEFKKDNIDRNKLLELSTRRETEAQEMKDFMIDKLIEFHNILTPDQRIKAVATMKEMKDKFHGIRDKMKQNKPKKND